MGIPIPKGRNRKEGWGDVSQASLKSRKANFMSVKALEESSLA